MLTVLGLVLNVLINLPVENEEFVYYAQPIIWGENDKVRIIDSSLTFNMKSMQIEMTDSTTSFFICDQSSEWNCITGPLINFAINKSWKSVPDRWVFEDNVFEKIATKDISLLGRVYNVNVIMVLEQGQETSEVMLYYYSPEHGIIMFDRYLFEEDNLSTYISSTSKGLLALRSE